MKNKKLSSTKNKKPSQSQIDKVKEPREKKIKKEEKTIRCIECGKEFADIEVGDSEKCPKCGTETLPMAISDDVDLKINWHELRILTMWADNWAKQCDRNDEENTKMFYSVMCIAQRLQRQHPDKSPITLFSEIRELRKHYDVETDIDNDEQLKL